MGMDAHYTGARRRSGGYWGQYVPVAETATEVAARAAAYAAANDLVACSGECDLLRRAGLEPELPLVRVGGRRTLFPRVYAPRVPVMVARLALPRESRVRLIRAWLVGGASRAVVETGLSSGFVEASL
jgi:hypothetical protein